MSHPVPPWAPPGRRAHLPVAEASSSASASSTFRIPTQDMNEGEGRSTVRTTPVPGDFVASATHGNPRETDTGLSDFAPWGGAGSRLPDPSVQGPYFDWQASHSVHLQNASREYLARVEEARRAAAIDLFQRHTGRAFSGEGGTRPPSTVNTHLTHDAPLGPPSMNPPGTWPMGQSGLPLEQWSDMSYTDFQQDPQVYHQGPPMHLVDDSFVDNTGINTNLHLQDPMNDWELATDNMSDDPAPEAAGADAYPPAGWDAYTGYPYAQNHPYGPPGGSGGGYQ